MDHMKLTDITTDCQKLIDAAAYDLQVLNELQSSGQLDQNMYHPRMRKVHEENGQLLEAFLEKYGWPLPSKCGPQAHEAAWFIAIHNIGHPPMLKNALRILKTALDAGEPVAQEYAKLFDRIALYEGRQQVYGTQFFPTPQGWHAENLVDPARVDERRAELGLSTFEQGKIDCGAGEGGFTEAAALVEYEKNWHAFVKEVGWQ